MSAQGSEAAGQISAFDAEEHRRTSLQAWEAAAPGWARRQGQMRQFAAPVSQWLLDALRLKPGESVLDLAAGIGETGFMAAQRVAPGGSVIVADQAEAMGTAARARAQELGLSNVEIRQINAEWIDLEVGHVDAVVCRWGLMLMADPDAALRECRRVLRPGGRIALAVWAAPQRNPWATVPMSALIERGVLSPPGRPPAQEADGGDGGGAVSLPPHTPGMFALADEEALRERLESAGFTEVKLGEVELARRHASFDDFWETTLDMSSIVHDAVMELPAAEMEEIRAAARQRLTPFLQQDGSLEVPAVTLVACACA